MEPDEMTSFNKCPPEVITEIFSHLLDVGSKIRLERVSKLFRDCVRNEESWKRNTTLEMKEFGSDRRLRSFLSHTKEINTLSLRDCDAVVSPQTMGTLFEFEHKLKIRHFHLSSTLPLVPSQMLSCPDNSLFVAFCLGTFHKSIESIDLSCCWHPECYLLKTCTLLLPRCTNLRHLTLRMFNDEGNPLLPALNNLNLETLHLSHFFNGFSEIEPEDLAAVFNSARGHSIRSLKVDGNGDLVSLSFSEFLGHLEPPAAQAITSMQLLNMWKETDWLGILATLPTQLPNLARMIISQDGAWGFDRDTAWQVASAVGEFVHRCLQRHNAIRVKLIFDRSPVFDRSEFNQWLWKYVINQEIRQSGTQRWEGEGGWKRTITKHCATIELDIR